MKRRIRDGLSSLPPLLDTQVSGHVGSGGELCVRGYALTELAESVSYEEVAHLLLHERLPNSDELREFSASLSTPRGSVPAVGSAVAQVFDGSEHPIGVITSCLAAIASTCSDPIIRSHEDLVDSSIKVTRWYGTLLADHIRKRHPADQLEEENGAQGFSEGFMADCFGNTALDKARYLDSLLVLASDQGLTASTFSARNAASTRSGFLGAVIAALQAWNGYRHGAASEYACKSLHAVKNEFEYDVERYVRRNRERGVPMFGFGHRRYKKTKDPRLYVLEDLTQRAYHEYGGRIYETASTVTSYFQLRNWQFANPDLYVAMLLDSLGFRAEEMAAVVFMGRLVGVCAHIIEENGPLRPMLRGESLYTGPELRLVPKIDDR